MRNLAGKGVEASIACREELREAGISYAVVLADREVGVRLGGVIKIGGYEIELVRKWVYWSVRIHKNPFGGFGLPRDLARALNDTPFVHHAGSRLYPSGSEMRLGSVVRARGHAGGLPSDQIDSCIDLWHIDTQEGLNEFAKWCYSNLEETKNDEQSTGV